MSEFKALDGGKTFSQPESPFLLLTEDVDGNVSYCWWDDEEKMQEDAIERRGYGEKIVVAIEISSYRTVDIPPEYMIDDFIEEVNSVYDTAKEQNTNNISIEIWTDTEEIYYINDIENGFQCCEFDYCFDNLDSIAECLFNEKMIGKPIEIKIKTESSFNES